jgi:hypothetical protein
MSITETHQPDLVAVKSRQRQTWASGDYAALAAARCGCEVTGIDYVPEPLDQGRERAAAELVRVCRPGGTIALANWTRPASSGGCSGP